MEESDKEDKHVYCICQKPYVDGQFMIECGKCNEWFHGSCVGIEEYQAQDIDVYVCPKCQPEHGPLVYSFLDVRCENGELVEEVKKRRNVRRHNYKEIHEGTKQITAGTVSFVRQLKDRKFAEPTDDVLLKFEDGTTLNVSFLHNNGFNKPIIVQDRKGLGLVVPPSNFTIYDVEKRVGSMQELHVIDVARQEDLRMKMREWTEYYNSPVRGKVLNVISLEFSDTSLSELVEAPEIVKHISWVENAWPKVKSEESPHTKPVVAKYCLMSVKDCYTDFHVDFGGTSVWYHVIRGEKIFYFIEPTEENLQKYSQWVSSSDQSQVFFGDKVNKCYKLRVEKGNTLFLPTGWIHAVLTPKDSLVFGGNFLHSFNIGGQQRIYTLEKSLQTPLKFLFPNFETTNWYAARAIMKRIKEIHQAGYRLPPFLAQGVHDLLLALRAWTSKKNEYVKYHKLQIPLEINPHKLMKSLEKELKYDTKMVKGKEFTTDALPSPANFVERISLNKNVIRLKLNRSSTRSGDESSSGLSSPEKAEHSKGLERLKRKRERLVKREKKLKEELESKKSLPSIKLNVNSDGSVFKRESSDEVDIDGIDHERTENTGSKIKLKLSFRASKNDMEHTTEGSSSSQYNKTSVERERQPVATNENKRINIDIKAEIEAAKKDIFDSSASGLYFHSKQEEDDCTVKPVTFSHSKDFRNSIEKNITENRNVSNDFQVKIHDDDNDDDDEEDDENYDDDGGGYIIDEMPKPKKGPGRKQKKSDNESDSDYDPDTDEDDDDNYYEDADFVYPRIDVDSHLEDDDFSWNPSNRRPRKTTKKKKNKQNPKFKDSRDKDIDPFFAPDTELEKEVKARKTKSEQKMKRISTEERTGTTGRTMKRKTSTAKQRLGKLLKLDKTGSRYMR